MNQQEFKEKLNKEFEEVELTDSPYKAAEKAFYERQAEVGQKSKNKKNRFWRNLSKYAVAALLIVSVVIGGIWLFGGEEDKDDTFIFDKNSTPYVQLSFDEISKYTDKNVKLPKDFDDEFELVNPRIFFPKENEPCAIGMEYLKTENDTEYSIKVTIMINSKYTYYDQDDYNVCDDNFEIDGTTIYFYSFAGENGRVILAKFEIDGNKYFLDSMNIEMETIIEFIESLN